MSLKKSPIIELGFFVSEILVDEIELELFQHTYLAAVNPELYAGTYLEPIYTNR